MERKSINQKIDECTTLLEVEKIKAKLLYGIYQNLVELAAKRFVYK
jgi:hypothetical protein